MKLSIIIPVYNEKDTVMKALEEVDKVNLNKEIIVVDDGSIDGTREILKEMRNAECGMRNVKIIFHEKNMGKGAAIRTAISHVTGDIIVIQDGDLEYNPGEFINLIKPVTGEKFKVVYGSRFLKKNPLIYRRYYLGNKLLSFFTSIFYFQKITDAYTCYKMMKTEVLKSLNLKSKSFEVEAEITAKLLKAGYEIHEVPISYNPRRIEEGKKISWKDAFLGIWTIIKVKFLP